MRFFWDLISFQKINITENRNFFMNPAIPLSSKYRIFCSYSCISKDCALKSNKIILSTSNRCVNLACKLSRLVARPEKSSS